MSWVADLTGVDTGWTQPCNTPALDIVLELTGEDAGPRFAVLQL